MPHNGIHAGLPGLDVVKDRGELHVVDRVVGARQPARGHAQRFPALLHQFDHRRRDRLEVGAVGTVRRPAPLHQSVVLVRDVRQRLRLGHHEPARYPLHRLLGRAPWVRRRPFRRRANKSDSNPAPPRKRSARRQQTPPRPPRLERADREEPRESTRDQLVGDSNQQEHQHDDDKHHDHGHDHDHYDHHDI